MTDVSIFVSYAHADNTATHGRVERIAKDVSLSYGAITGMTAGTFFDTESIALGEHWRERIWAGLGSATILLAFVSPQYLRSSACRAEFREFLSFLSQGGSSRLIVPLLMTSKDRMDRQFSDDDLWHEVADLQYLLIDEMNFEDPGTGAWMKTVMRIAERVDEKLSEQADRGGEISIPEPSPEQESQMLSRGSLDLIAQVEEDLPKVAQTATRYSSLIDKFNSEVIKATPRMQQATSFRQKLAVSHDLANAIGPIVDESEEAAQEMISIVRSIDPGTVALIRFAKNAPDNGTPEVQEFLKVIKQMAMASVQAMSATESFEASIATSKGNSADLDKPLSKMQSTLLLVAETKAIYNSWLEEIAQD